MPTGPAGRARLLFAQSADGEPLATLFLVRSGPRVVEPYGGMTQAGADSRANYLLKWEAIRTSREQGATSYDLWGLATGGIAHFKTGFGGREVRYIGAWDLVLDPFGRAVYEGAGRARVWWARRRHGVAGGGNASAFGGAAGVAPSEGRAATAGRAGRLGRARVVQRPGGHVYQSRGLGGASCADRLASRASCASTMGSRCSRLNGRGHSWAVVQRLPAARPDRRRGARGDDRGPPRGRHRAGSLGRGVDVARDRRRGPGRRAATGSGSAAAGFQPIPEIQPSRHRISLPLPPRYEGATRAEPEAAPAAPSPIEHRIEAMQSLAERTSRRREQPHHRPSSRPCRGAPPAGRRVRRH